MKNAKGTLVPLSGVEIALAMKVKMIPRRETISSIKDCLWKEVQVLNDKILTSTTYFNGKAYTSMTTSRENVEEMEQCIWNVTSWPGCLIKRNIYTYKGKYVILNRQVNACL